jgi:hypothetical protein
LRNIYLPDYWRFYVTKAAQQELHSRVTFLVPDDDLQALPRGSLLLGAISDPYMQRLIETGAETIATIPEIDRESFFTIVQR